MKRRVLATNGTSVSFRMPSVQVEGLKRMARAISAKEDRDVMFTDLLRDAVVAQYPELCRQEAEPQVRLES